MKIKVNSEFCLGCGLCEELVPEIFRLKGDTVELINDVIPEEISERVEFAIEDCPGKAIQTKRTTPPGYANRSGFAESLQ
ncbi:MAG: ferredoxin [Spirochaetales bacterium]|nr:ferredoxin [Spirochaetales bacterium]